MKEALLQALFRRRTKEFLKKDDAYYINLLNADMSILQNEYYRNLPFLVYSIAQAVLAATAILHMDWMLFASIFLALFPMLITNFFADGLRRRRNAVSKANEDYLNTSKESIQGYEAIKAADKVSAWLTGFHASTIKQHETIASEDVFRRMSNESIRSITSLMQLLAIGFAGYLITIGALTAGNLFSIVYLISYISSGTNNFIELMNSVRSVKGIMNKVQSEMESMESEPTSEMDVMDIEHAEVCYEKVGFSFEKKKLFSEFSYRFEQGKCYVIVGESGSGKTTLLRLLLKYFDNYDGSISISDYDIANLTERSVNHLVGIVNQTPYLFNRSLYFNIMLSDQVDPHTQAEYEGLLAKLNLTELSCRVREQPLGDFGDNISGGERQRISIARALAQNPRILIFDEPTSALHPENKAQIMNLIFSMEHITRIVISHDWAQDFLDRFDGVIHIESYNPREDIIE